MEKYDFIELILSFIVGVLVMMIITLIFIKEPQYKKGQINALNGQINYELVTKSDSTRTWESIKTD